MKHYEVQFQPDNLTVRIHEGATLFEAAGQAGIILTSPCGGVGRCFKCRVQLLPSKKDVLACQHKIEHDTTVLIPDSSRFFKQQILEHGIQFKIDGHPCVRKIFVASPFPQIDALCEMLSKRLQSPVTVIPKHKETVSSQLATFQDNGITAVMLYSDQKNVTEPHYILSGLENGDTTDKLYGLAVDIGTTSVVARLVNLNTGDFATTASVGNPQGKYGADVISRISHCEKENGPEQLHRVIIDCLNELIKQTTEEAGVSRQDVYEIVAAGNTTMNHLFLNDPVIQLGQAPYEAHRLACADLCPSELTLEINPAGNIHTLSNIAGFVGSDTVAAALACRLDVTDINTLLVDIGTNCEIVYGTQTHLLAASCAAGPALEGAGIEFGSRAQSGAIERVVFDDDDGDIDVDIIGESQAISICGSGLIDAIAVMLELEIIDLTGRFYESDELDPFLSGSIKKRLILHDEKPAFVLTGNLTQNGWENPVLLTQKDIRQLQLAKAAIRAGIELLLKNAQSCPNDIQQLLLAGAFGNYIQKENSVRIGLLPKIPLDKIHFVGNAAGSGAEMTLLSQNARNLAQDLAEQIDYIEIAHQTEFQMVFSEFLLFPEK